MSPAQPARCAARARATASTVLNAAMLATTRFAPIAFASVFRIAIFSSKVKVALSPSEPGATMPSQPFSICHFACLATNAWSTP